MSPRSSVVAVLVRGSRSLTVRGTENLGQREDGGLLFGLSIYLMLCFLNLDFDMIMTVLVLWF